MGFSSGTVDVTEKATFVCGVPEAGVMIKNTGSSVVYLGGEDVGNDPSGGSGYPLDPGAAETFTGTRAKESPVVPAPPGDLDPPGLYARSEDGSAGRVAFFSVAMT